MFRACQRIRGSLVGGALRTGKAAVHFYVRQQHKCIVTAAIGRVLAIFCTILWFVGSFRNEDFQGVRSIPRSIAIAPLLPRPLQCIGQLRDGTLPCFAVALTSYPVMSM